MHVSCRYWVAVAVTASLVLPGCGHDHSSNAEPFDTLQACFDEHHNHESLPTDQSIVICCLDHPIAGVLTACGTTQTPCETFVRANLDDAVTTAEITTACADYVVQLTK